MKKEKSMNEYMKSLLAVTLLLLINGACSPATKDGRKTESDSGTPKIPLVTQKESPSTDFNEIENINIEETTDASSNEIIYIIRVKLGDQFYAVQTEKISMGSFLLNMEVPLKWEDTGNPLPSIQVSLTCTTPDCLSKNFRVDGTEEFEGKFITGKIMNVKNKITGKVTCIHQSEDKICNYIYPANKDEPLRTGFILNIDESELQILSVDQSPLMNLSAKLISEKNRPEPVKTLFTATITQKGDVSYFYGFERGIVTYGQSFASEKNKTDFKWDTVTGEMVFNFTDPTQVHDLSFVNFKMNSEVFKKETVNLDQKTFFDFSDTENKWPLLN